MKNGLEIDKCGNKWWYLDGKLHRTDGPAIEYADGDKCWYLDGKRHRTDGPAIEWTCDHKVWFYQGKLLDCKTQEEFETLLALRAFW